MADRYNIDATQGSTLLLNITCRDSNDNYLNFSGYSSRGYVRQKFSSTGVLLDIHPVIHPSCVSGLITISGYSEDIADIPVGVYPYDIEVYITGGYTFKPIKGYFYVSPEATF